MTKSSSSRRHLGRTGAQQHAARSPLPASCHPHPALGSSHTAASHLQSTDNAPVAAHPPTRCFELEAHCSTNHLVHRDPPPSQPPGGQYRRSEEWVPPTAPGRAATCPSPWLNPCQGYPAGTAAAPGQAGSSTSLCWKHLPEKKTLETSRLSNPLWGSPAHTPGHILHIQPNFCIALFSLSKNITFWSKVNFFSPCPSKD